MIIFFLENVISMMVVIHSMEIALTLRSNKYIVRIIISVTKKAFTFIVPDIPK